MHAPNAGLAGFLSKRSFGLVYRSSPANQEPANRLLIAEELKKYIAIRGVCAIMYKLFQVRAGALRLFRRKLMGFLNKRFCIRKPCRMRAGFFVAAILAKARDRGGERDSSSGAKAQRRNSYSRMPLDRLRRISDGHLQHSRGSAHR